MGRRKGFTLIELLVVIAIIGILAAMLFPVFARARESARKTQCLANVKNLAIAFNMYLTDYDRFPPDATDSATTSYFFADEDTAGPGATDPLWSGATCDSIGRTYMANPFLRVPVILDDYVKNRDVWNCPSAKMEMYASFIVPDFYPGGWLQYMKDTCNTGWGEGSGTGRRGPCRQGSYPTGWGGVITDSIAQGALAEGEETAFHYSVGVNVGGENAGQNLSSLQDVAKYVIVGDIGLGKTPVYAGDQLAFPDVCGGHCVCGGYGDWENCGVSDCSIGTGEYGLKWFTDPGYRKKWTRHLGGSNIGFADGHAKWYQAESILAQSPIYEGGCWCGPVIQRGLEGLAANQPTHAADGSLPADYWSGCGVPPGYAPLF